MQQASRQCAHSVKDTSHGAAYSSLQVERNLSIHLSPTYCMLLYKHVGNMMLHSVLCTL